MRLIREIHEEWLFISQLRKRPLRHRVHLLAAEPQTVRHNVQCCSKAEKKLLHGAYAMCLKLGPHFNDVLLVA